MQAWGTNLLLMARKDSFILQKESSFASLLIVSQRQEAFRNGELLVKMVNVVYSGKSLLIQCAVGKVATVTSRGVGGEPVALETAARASQPRDRGRDLPSQEGPPVPSALIDLLRFSRQRLRSGSSHCRRQLLCSRGVRLG